MFMMKASVWLALIKRWRPDIRAACDNAYSRARVDGDFTRLEKEAFSACPADSIDYAVMEKMGGQSDTPAVVVPLAAGWSDVGAWSSLWEVNPHDAQGNAVRGRRRLVGP